MLLLRLLSLLLAVLFSGLHSLPWSIDILESQGPGSILQSFTFNCSSYTPTLALFSVKPPTGFFNEPSLHQQNGIYVGKVTLSSSARLDALAVNRYELQVQYKCGNFVREVHLFVHVQPKPSQIQCAGPFASPAGEFIYVPETVSPGALLYTLLLPGLGHQKAQMNITSAQDPPFFPGPFSIDDQGLLRAPAQGLRGQAQKAFQLRILASAGKSGSCKGMLTVKVLPQPSSRVSFLTQIPETAPVGTVLNALTCVDPDSAGAPLDYQLRFHSPPDSASLRLNNGVLEVNTTLDCDAPGACFQHAAFILVFDGGQPQMTRPLGQVWVPQASSLPAEWSPAEVPVLVTVTLVNEFSPACVARTFRVREDAGPHTLLGSIAGTDADYPPHSLEYYISGRPSTFAVDRLSGELHLLGPLDYEQQRLYRIVILLIDHSQDWDLNHRRSGSCTITIEVEDVNDHAPECEPPFQELTIHPPLGRSTEVTQVSCWIPQEPQRLAFSYSIVGGNSQSRFRLQGSILVHNDTVLGPPWPEQPRTYELLIHAADAGPSVPHLSTTATIIVHVVPWKASTVATSTHRSTVSSTMTPLIVTDVEAFWKPDPWFVIVLTAIGAVLLLALGWLVSRILQGLAQSLQARSKPARSALLLNRIQGNEGSIERHMEAPRMEMSQGHFDGRAQDVRTGRDYLFSTRTGARRWL
ncbi:cadherin-related family member 4 isoform X4 [Meriones unguiculatus]|uniref:cadherin-related family member 4 isoform X4 n=1 Tax=Meriones unguiculatus TaxID=10047 RepID=UPI00293E7A24|nr:cadherin-related family member 4 isoform X4 [Meriones unguiculatus]